MTAKQAIRIIRKEHMPKALLAAFRAVGYERELEAVYARTAELFTENEAAPKALQTHLNQILPCIAFYEALSRVTGDKEKALDFFDKYAFSDIERIAKFLPPLMKLGLYKKVPDLCDGLLDRFFGEEAGFESRPVPDAPKFARDMTVCPYFETCKKYDCPEITQFFCKSDDITYGNLHPKLVWGRTQTLGMGGECCDFRLYLKEE